MSDMLCSGCDAPFYRKDQICCPSCRKLLNFDDKSTVLVCRNCGKPNGYLTGMRLSELPVLIRCQCGDILELGVCARVVY
jgi:predicted amidophosphoribosyltransferase